MKAELTEAELIAVAILAQVEAMSMQTENETRRESGQAQAYGQLYSDASTRLTEELKRRGVL